MLINNLLVNNNHISIAGFLLQEDGTVGTSDASVEDPIIEWQSESSSR